MSQLEEIKRSLSIDEFDTKQDELLLDLEKRVGNAICSYLGVTSTPAELEWILVEATIARFNLIGSEGISVQNIEGNSTTYRNDDVVVQYQSHLAIWKENHRTTPSRRVRFL